MANALLLAKAAALAADERGRKVVGWAVAAILSPLILAAALLCSLVSIAGSSLSIADLCFSDRPIPADVPKGYRTQIEDMRSRLVLLEDWLGPGLDGPLVKAIFYALYFGTDAPVDYPAFLDRFDGAADTEDIYENIRTGLGIQVTQEQRQVANSVYRLLASTPYVGVGGVCSPIGKDWRELVTSEFGWRLDPITGRPSGHSGIDLAVPIGTPIRAALPGTVITSTYNKAGYGNYVMLDHGNGLVTLYGHCSQLLARQGQTVEAGDVIALSGSTGRSTGPHLHFEVRVNGERTEPRKYLP